MSGDFMPAPFDMAAMANPAQQGWLNAVYAALRQHHEGYYEDSVTLLSLLVMTGNYWDPTRVRKAGTSGVRSGHKTFRA